MKTKTYTGDYMIKILTIIRWIYAAFFFLIGAQSLLVIAGILPSSEFPGSPETKAFTEAIFATGFIGPIMTITYVASGILMLFNRTAPLGIVLLAPFVVVILFTHLMLNGSPAFGILLAAFLGLFAWQFREAYQPMWNYQNSSLKSNSHFFTTKVQRLEETRREYDKKTS